MCTTDHKYRDISTTKAFDFRGVRGSVRLRKGKIITPKEAGSRVERALKLRPKTLT